MAQRAIWDERELHWLKDRNNGLDEILARVDDFRVVIESNKAVRQSREAHMLGHISWYETPEGKAHLESLAQFHAAQNNDAGLLENYIASFFGTLKTSANLVKRAAGYAGSAANVAVTYASKAGIKGLSYAVKAAAKAYSLVPEPLQPYVKAIAVSGLAGIIAACGGAISTFAPTNTPTPTAVERPISAPEATEQPTPDNIQTPESSPTPYAPDPTDTAVPPIEIPSMPTEVPPTPITPTKAPTPTPEPSYDIGFSKPENWPSAFFLSDSNSLEEKLEFKSSNPIYLNVNVNRGNIEIPGPFSIKLNLTGTNGNTQQRIENITDINALNANGSQIIANIDIRDYFRDLGPGVYRLTARIVSSFADSNPDNGLASLEFRVLSPPEPTATPRPTPTQPPAPTPEPRSDLRISATNTTFSHVNDNDGSSLYIFRVHGTYGLIKPDKPFDIGVRGLEGLVNTAQPVTTINNDGTFLLELPVNLPPGNYKISFEADIGRAITETRDDNNTFGPYTLIVAEPPTYTKAEWDYFVELAFRWGNGQSKVFTPYKKPIRVMVFGEPTPEQREYLDTRIAIARELGYNVQYTINPDESNLPAHLKVNGTELPSIYPRADPAKLKQASGVAYPEISSNGEMIRCTIAVTKPNPSDPPFYFLNTTSEEFFTCLAGLFFDGSTRYPESIFRYGRHQYLVDPHPNIDLRVMQLAGEDVLKPGMTPEQARRYIRVVDSLPSTR